MTIPHAAGDATQHASPHAEPSGVGRGVALVATASVLWGTGGLAVQLIRRDVAISPLVLSAERMLLGAATMVMITVALGAWPRVLTLLRSAPRAAIGVGFGTAIYQGLYFASVVRTGVAVATVVSLAIAPVLLALHQVWRTKRLPSGERIAILAVALTGLVLVCAPVGDVAVGPSPGLGVVLAIGSGATYALTTLVGGRVAETADPVALTTVATCAGGVLLAPVLVVVVATSGLWQPNTAASLAWLIYLGVATMALSYLCLYSGLRTVTAASATIVSLLEPVTAAVVAWWVLDERLGVTGWIGTALVLAAVVGLATRRDRSGAAAAD